VREIAHRMRPIHAQPYVILVEWLLPDHHAVQWRKQFQSSSRLAQLLSDLEDTTAIEVEMTDDDHSLFQHFDPVHLPFRLSATKQR
jgi:hypothetical protein